MKERETIIIFTSSEKALIANALKQQINFVDPNWLVIIIDEQELYTRVLSDFLTSQLKFQFNIKRIEQTKRAKKVAESMDCVGNFDLVFRNSTSYKRMENIFLRYKPKAVILTGVDGLIESTSVRDKLKSKTKVFLYDTELLFNKQLLNPYLDHFFVANEASFERVIAHRIKPCRVSIAGIAYPTEYNKTVLRAEANKILGLINKKRTVLFLFDETYSSSQMKSLVSILSNHTNKYNYLIWSKDNEEVSKIALLSGYKVYNKNTVDFSLLLSASNVIVTKPSSFYFTIAFRAEKLCVSLGNSQDLDELIVEAYKDKIIVCKTLIRLNNFLTLYPNEDYEKIRSNSIEFQYESPSEKILSQL